MKIAVTGALGHIGSYIIRNLASNVKNIEFLLLDNFLTQRYSSLFSLNRDTKYKFYEIDVSVSNLDSLFNDIDIVIHLAAITDAANSFNNSNEVERNNLQATKNVANSALNTATKLIFLSSTSVYGTQKDVVDEDCSEEELMPQSPYAETKLREEELIASLGLKGLQYICCRFGTIFGVSQGMRFHTAVNKFCWQAVMGQEISVWETAFDQSRPYLDLYDASRSFGHIINNDIFDNETYNVLTRNATVRDVTQAIEKLIPDLKIAFVKNKIMNQLSYEVLSRKFENSGFNFKGSLEKGIEDTINIIVNSNRSK